MIWKIWMQRLTAQELAVMGEPFGHCYLACPVLKTSKSYYLSIYTSFVYVCKFSLAVKWVYLYLTHSIFILW